MAGDIDSTEQEMHAMAAREGAVLRLGFPRWLLAFTAAGVWAVTLGRFVFLRGEVLKLPREGRDALMLHELAHVRQYARHGLPGFLARYLGEYVSNRWRGLGAASAYEAISFEVEARLAEAAAWRSDERGDDGRTM